MSDNLISATSTEIETLLKRTLLLEQEFNQKSSTLPPHLLQLRLDQESLLKKIIHLHRSLCLALGIESGKSPEVNLERAVHALGVHGLQKKFRVIAHLANLFAEVTEFVERFIEAEKKRKERLQKVEEKPLEKKNKLTEGKRTEKIPPQKKIESQMTPAVEHELHEALDLQTQFQHSVEQLTEALQKYAGLAEFGLLLNHISGIKHPHSLFYAGKSEQLEYQARIARLKPR